MGARRLKGTQAAWVRMRLLAGDVISHLDLVMVCGGRGGWRLAAIVHRLRGDGWPIESRLMPNPGPNTDLNPPVVYRLQTGWRPGGPVQLAFPL